MELANSNKIFGDELTNNIIGVHTSVQNPAMRNPPSPSGPAPAPAPAPAPSNNQSVPYPSDIIYPAYPMYPYPYPLEYSAPIILAGVETGSGSDTSNKKTSSSNPSSSTRKESEELTFFQKPIGKIIGLGIFVLAIYGGYRAVKN